MHRTISSDPGMIDSNEMCSRVVYMCVVMCVLSIFDDSFVQSTLCRVVARVRCNAIDQVEY
jgi:hypothetical protein